MMKPEQIARINELARKAKAEGLNAVEKAEQADLRRQYIDAVKASLAPQLENIRYVEPDGTITKPDGTVEGGRPLSPNGWPEHPNDRVVE